MNKLYSKRGEAGISTTGKKAMGNLVTTTSKPMLSDMLSPNGSGRLMQDATVNSWASMSSNRSDIYSSNKQAPVAPVSVPMFATDLLEFKRDQTSNAVSFVIHVVAITLLLTIALKVHNSVVLEEPPIVTPVDFKLTVPPPITMPVAKVEGGGGQRSIVQPKADPVPTPIARAPQIHTTQIIRLDNPKLALEPSDQVKMPDSPNALPAFAASQGPQIALATQPKATGSGFGSLGGGGLGGGHGVGSGGGYGGGLMSVGAGGHSYRCAGFHRGCSPCEFPGQRLDPPDRRFTGEPARRNLGQPSRHGPRRESYRGSQAVQVQACHVPGTSSVGSNCDRRGLPSALI
jgi:hypothetical protein